MEIESTTCQYSEAPQKDDSLKLNISDEAGLPADEAVTTSKDAIVIDTVNKNNQNIKNKDNNIDDNNNNSVKPAAAHKKKRCRRKRKAGEHHRSWKNSWDDDIGETTTGHIVKIFKGFNGIGKQTVVQPMAPNNTNQFLMDDHCLQSTPSPFYDKATNRGERSRTRKMSINDDLATNNANNNPSYDEDDKYLSDSDSSTARLVGSEVDLNDEDDDQYMCTDFMKEYENYRINTLQAMNKEGLIKECLRLETQLEECQRENEKLLRTIRNLNNNNNCSSNNNNNNTSVNYVHHSLHVHDSSKCEVDYDDDVNNNNNNDNNNNNNNDDDKIFDDSYNGNSSSNNNNNINNNKDWEVAKEPSTDGDVK